MHVGQGKLQLQLCLLYMLSLARYDILTCLQHLSPVCDVWCTVRYSTEIHTILKVYIKGQDMKPARMPGAWAHKMGMPLLQCVGNMKLPNCYRSLTGLHKWEAS